jgi:Arc/MetJ-type ribon-helix-helix transcriptional regulator
MDESQRVTVDISADLIAAVNDAVEAGLYASADQVINDALGLWREGQSQQAILAPPPSSCTAEEHDLWFRAEVQKTLSGLADGTVEILNDEEHRQRREQRRAVIQAKAAG